MRAFALMGSLTLAAAACNDHGDSSGTCEEVASAAAAKCGATFDESTCVSECNGHSHPEGHLGSSRDAVEAASDCMRRCKSSPTRPSAAERRSVAA